MLSSQFKVVITLAILSGILNTRTSAFQCIDGESCFSSTTAPGANCTYGGVRIYCPASSPSNHYLCNLAPSAITSVTAGDGTISAVTTGTNVVVEATGSFGSKAISTSNNIAATGNLIVNGTTRLAAGKIVTTGNGDMTATGYIAPVGLLLATGFVGPLSEGIVFSGNPVSSPFTGSPTVQIIAPEPLQTFVLTIDDIRETGAYLVASTRSGTIQSGSITAPVTASGTTGTIITASSTLAPATTATFVVTNTYYTASSQVIQLTVQYAGSSGIPYAFIAATAPGSNEFTIGIYNMGAALLNDNILVQFSIN